MINPNPKISKYSHSISSPFHETEFLIFLIFLFLPIWELENTSFYFRLIHLITNGIELRFMFIGHE